jgi:hypothetical protein
VSGLEILAAYMRSALWLSLYVTRRLIMGLVLFNSPASTTYVNIASQDGGNDGGCVRICKEAHFKVIQES